MSPLPAETPGEAGTSAGLATAVSVSDGLAHGGQSEPAGVEVCQ